MLLNHNRIKDIIQLYQNFVGRYYDKPWGASYNVAGDISNGYMLAEGGILTQQVIHLTSDTKLKVEGSTNNSLTN
jgi:hypothetical protein